MNDHPLALSTADRDELAVAALARMKPFERRVLALLYGLPGIADANGELHSVAEICAKTRSSETKIARVAKNALDKLGAVLDLEPVAAGRHLFRLGVHWGAGVRRQESGWIEFTPIDRPTSPGAYWYRDRFKILGVMVLQSWNIEDAVNLALLNGVTFYGPAIPSPQTSNPEPPPTP